MPRKPLLLGAQEEPGTWFADAPAQHQLITEAGLGRACSEPEGLGTAFGVEPGSYRDRLGERGFAGAVGQGERIAAAAAGAACSANPVVRSAAVTAEVAGCPEKDYRLGTGVCDAPRADQAQGAGKSFPHDKPVEGYDMVSMDRIRALLLEHDDPRHLERPADFDRETSRICFARLGSALEERFGPSCISALGQDTSFYGVIEVPADATGLGLPIGVAMSNFGGYFVTAKVAVYEDVPDGEASLTEEFVTWFDGVCTAMGCIFVPSDLLREPYDGPTVLAAAGDAEFAAVLVAAGVAEYEESDEDLGKTNWYDRYFEYM